ncbi:MAG: 2Fe-2S iron-sulfur cluster-binding protein [Alphaproteobacteria bacterium]|nr:2Fe-2S iron-sulfur cluster-binding protein [Alphaproteobacteria bacterium]
MSIKIKVNNYKTGEVSQIDAPLGYQVMEAIRDHDLPILAECGGSLACATCHVKVAEKWLKKLPPMRDDERDMLDMVANADEHSRLSCQLIVTEELNGLEVSLTPESLRQ